VGPALEPLRKLTFGQETTGHEGKDPRKPKYGAYFVTGNHEYIVGEVEEALRKLKELGVTTLRNEKVLIEEKAKDGKGNVPYFELAGVDDPTSSRFNIGHGPDLPKALKSQKEEREGKEEGDLPVILLAHQPKQIHEAATLGVDVPLRWVVASVLLLFFSYFL
jgi:predicted MPP superfamily phosphohydrolase